MPVLAHQNKELTTNLTVRRFKQTPRKPGAFAGGLSLALLGGTGCYLLLGCWWADPAATLVMVSVISWQDWLAFRGAKEENA